MEVLRIQKCDEIMDTFLQKANAAYQVRSNEKLPFAPITLSDIKDDEQIFLLMDGNEAVSGCCIYRLKEKVVRLQHVWTDTQKTRQGYASYLIREVEKIVKEQGELQLKLGVVSAYLPAYRLYRAMGWKRYAILANQPKTCYTISMVKYLGDKGRFRFECRRCFQYLLSKIKFFMLFKKDSTPKWLYRTLYKVK